MKKFSLIISVLALVMGLSQCQKKPNMPTFNGGYAGVTKEITFTTGNGGSKATIDNSVLKELHYKWESTDVIHVYGSQAGNFTDGQYCGELKLVSAPGFEAGVFKGTLYNVPTTGKLRFYYFGGGNKDAVIDLSEQDGNIDNGAESLNKKIVASVDATINAAEYSAELKVLYSIIKFDLTNFVPTGSCDITMKGTKNNSFKINENGNMIETAGTTTTLKGVSASSTSYYVAAIPEDVNEFKFSGNGKIGFQKTTKALEANCFYTLDGESYKIEVRDYAAAPTVESVHCLNCDVVVGGIVKSETAQECDYGVVYAKTSEISGSEDIVIGGSNCTSCFVNTSEVKSDGLPFNIDITGFEEGVGYSFKAYAIGENGVAQYGDAVNFVGGDLPRQLPENWVNGRSPYPFTVGEGKTVYFSQGNLQYIGSADSPYFKFADQQMDVLGIKTGQNSKAENVDRDLFGWGTSGWNNGNDYYMPFNTGSNGHREKGQGYGPSNGENYRYSLTGTYAESDWGVYNKIRNGGDEKGLWRTPTNDEWKYLIGIFGDGHQTVSPCRANAGQLYGMGRIECSVGLIILPDNWNADYCPSFICGISDCSSSNTNIFTYSEWSAMESHGAVFLPLSGLRTNNVVKNIGENGTYWSSSNYVTEENYRVHDLILYHNNVLPGSFSYRQDGYSVRLISDIAPGR